MHRSPHNIGIVCYPTFGGSGIIATELGVGLACRGYKVHLIATAPPVRLPTACKRLQFQEVAVPSYPLFAAPPYTLALASRLVELVEQHELDIVHLHYALPHAVSAQLARQLLGPRAPRFVVTLHGTDVTHLGKDPAYHPVLRAALLACDGLTTPSEFLRQEAIDTFALPPSSITTIPNFVDTQRFCPPSPRSPSRLSSLFPEAPELSDSPILVHVSNLRPVKRPFDVIDTFAKVASRRPVRLLMIGDGPARDELSARVAALHLQKQVRFLGKQKEFAHLLGHCDVMLLPSESESFGLAALEALSCGVPVVASAIGGLLGLLKTGENGILAPLGDTSAMAQAVESILASPARAQQMSQHARNTALAYSGPTVFDAYDAYYSHLRNLPPSSDTPHEQGTCSSCDPKTLPTERTPEPSQSQEPQDESSSSLPHPPHTHDPHGDALPLWDAHRKPDS